PARSPVQRRRNAAGRRRHQETPARVAPAPRAGSVITIKSGREIEIMRRGGKITASTLSMLLRTARAGMTTAELDRLAEESIRAQGGEPTFKGYNGFPASICVSVNDVVVHGIPSN